MDEKTSELLSHFLEFLQKELSNHANKKFKHVNIVNWHLKDFRVTVDVFIEEKKDEIYFDIREIKENKDHFLHLLSSAVQQLESKTN